LRFNLFFLKKSTNFWCVNIDRVVGIHGTIT
jgi:hypothetical protein